MKFYVNVVIKAVKMFTYKKVGPVSQLFASYYDKLNDSHNGNKMTLLIFQATKSPR
jgi:hypothetical protein